MLTINLSEKSVIVFDLDDTLYKEIDFLRSGFQEIARRIDSNDWFVVFEDMMEWYENGQDVFSSLLNRFSNCQLNKSQMLDIYRYHIPAIRMEEATQYFLKHLAVLKIKTALITDGRAITQRNKLNALGLGSYFNKIVISEEVGSEKPAEANFKFIEDHFGEGSYIYFGDNYNKDFVSPNKLGWQTIAIEGDVWNIHSRNTEVLPVDYLPHYLIKDFSEIQLCFQE